MPRKSISAAIANIPKPELMRRLDQLEQTVALKLRKQMHASRTDVFSNPGTGLARRNSKTVCNQWTPGVRRNRWELDNLFEFNPMLARIVSREPTDAIEPGFDVDELDEQENKDVADFLGRREFSENLIEAGEWERLHGGAAIFMDIDDGLEDTTAPVSINTIREFGQMTVLDRHEIFAISFQTDLRKGRLFATTMYQLAEGSELIHPSRLLIFPGKRLPKRRMMENQGWGGSVADAVMHKLEQWDTSGDYLAEGVVRSSQGVMTFPDLKNASTEQGGTSDIEGRIEALALHMSMLGDIALDKDESYQVVTRTLTGFGEANNVFVDGLVAVTDMPKSILFGQTAGGLNTGENAGDWQSWTSHLSGVQTRKFTRQVIKALRYIFAAENTPLQEAPETINLEWGSLFQLSETEEAANLATTATATQALVLSGVVLPEEARRNESIIRAYSLDQDDGGFEGEGELEDPGREEEVDPAEETALIGEETEDASPGNLIALNSDAQNT